MSRVIITKEINQPVVVRICCVKLRYSEIHMVFIYK